MKAVLGLAPRRKRPYEHTESQHTNREREREERKMNVRKILREYSLLVLLLLLFILCIPSSLAGGIGRAMDPLLQEEYCKNFTYGNKDKEFFSPGFPRDYPPGIKCFRTISADYGYFVRVDFRDSFYIEPPTSEGNCDYDYLEVS